MRYEEYGDPGVLRVVDVEAQHPGAGRDPLLGPSGGVNAVDWKVRAGPKREVTPPSLPAVIALVTDEEPRP